MDRLWQCIVADFKQRTRQQSFIVALMMMAVLTLLFFPSPDAYYQTLVFNGYRGIYNSAWLGVCLAMLNVLFLPIISFYLVKNAVELDRQSMTGELIAASPISKLAFLFAKWCSNVFILITIVLIMLLSSIVIQLYYGESYQINLWALVWPQLVFVLPMLLVIAAIAILFESINCLKGGLSNVTYFFLWVGFIVQSMDSVSGIGALLDHIEAEVTERFPLSQGNTNIGLSISDRATELNSFVWQGIEPTIMHLWAALPLFFISLCCLLLALIFFDRFSKSSIVENSPTSRFNFNLKARFAGPLDRIFVKLTEHFAFTRTLRLEMKLLLKGHSLYWLIGLLVLNLMQLFISQNLLSSLLLPISWLWCVLIISQLGQMEKNSNTLELITSSNQSPILLSLATYCAALLVLALASMGSIVRFTANAEWLLLIQLIIAIAFTVSLAYFCGAFTGTKRMFEGLYPALCYMGPMQTVLYVDFFGVDSQASWQAGVPYYFLGISISLLLLTIRTKNKG